jgi:disulfide bond formation protein DsbB
MTIPGRRQLNIVGFLACAGMMGYALFAQHVLLLDPCPLCVFQRIAVISLGIVFLIAALHNPGGQGRFLYTVLIALAAGAGMAVSGWHVRLQNLPADEVPACGPGFDYIIDAFPLADALKMIFSGSGECASIDWQFLGLSMPAWVFIAVAVTGACGIWNNLRRL